jgi:hypothetical protein
VARRRFILVSMAVAVASAWPASALAATAPSALQLTTAPWVSPAVLHWTPGADPLNTTQTVYRAPGACAAPPAAGVPVRVYPGNTTSEHFAVPGDGRFCFLIRAADAAGGTADSNAITIGVDTTNPTAAVAVSRQAAGGVVAGTVRVTRTSADAVSGVASSVLRLGAVGACGTGATLRANWDTTGYADGTYDVCNVVTDNAGHSTTAVVTVTVANTIPTPPPIPSPIPSPVEPVVATPDAPGASASPPAVPDVPRADKVAPRPPTKLAVEEPRSKSVSALVPVTLRWTNPGAPDLARVVVVLNPKRAPRNPFDGGVVYIGLRASASFKLRAGTTAYLALFAYDHAGNVSPAARRTVSLASLVPLRPLTGSVVREAPVLTWKPKEGTSYYNVQVFFNGRRAFVGWPVQPSFLLPANLLPPGTYTWFVWPAVKRKGATPAFGDLIGRATFVYESPAD